MSKSDEECDDIKNKDEGEFNDLLEEIEQALAIKERKMELKRREEQLRKELKERQEEECNHLIRKQMGEYGPVIFDWISRFVGSKAGREIISLDGDELLLYHEKRTSCTLDRSGTLHIKLHGMNWHAGVRKEDLELKCTEDFLTHLNYHHVYEDLYRAICDGSIRHIIRERFSPREERKSEYALKKYQRTTQGSDKYE